MSFCPKCRYEYRDGINRCPDCDETLVAVLPPKNTFDQDETIDEKDWVPLVRLTSMQ